ncbi:hypothetical protein PRCB_00165 [Pantoea rodasii]|uniref:Uncharacterized protein n=1 Tax=Pantoea rodasii TaxID=1076549 RepID=A0A2M9WJ19_9GAMM|nr:DUF1330 domain-containing protein [Pantoea rodasii]ORM61833.1 hypothetical protein HA45_19660 [Pantoea rodasii]PJZ07551.1 hypothetical protein PRCB_00165 [Pantoea rodasii]
MVSFLPDALEDFLSGDDQSEVVMLNLIKFNPEDGREQYLHYLTMAQPILSRFGARILYSGDTLPILTTGHEKEWDAVTLVYYPRRAAFKNMVDDAEYQVVFQTGAAAIADLVLQPLTNTEIMRGL